MDAEKQEMIGEDGDCDTDYSCEVMKPVDKDEMFVDCNSYFGKCICDEKSGTLGDIVIEKKEKKFQGDVKSEAKEEHDWVNLMDAEKQEMIGEDCDCDTDCNCEVVKPVDKDATFVDCDFCFGKCICDEENGNQKDVVIEKKEEKFPKYATMGFNWKEVDPIFKGQLEKMDDVNDDFRYVYMWTD